MCKPNRSYETILRVVQKCIDPVAEVLENIQGQFEVLCVSCVIYKHISNISHCCLLNGHLYMSFLPALLILLIMGLWCHSGR